MRVKPGKLSKSDKIDPEQEAADRAWLANLPKTKHFAVGTEIVQANKVGMILERDGDALKIQWRDDSVSYVRPIALRNHSVLLFD